MQLGGFCSSRRQVFQLYCDVGFYGVILNSGACSLEHHLISACTTSAICVYRFQLSKLYCLLRTINSMAASDRLDAKLKIVVPWSFLVWWKDVAGLKIGASPKCLKAPFRVWLLCFSGSGKHHLHWGQQEWAMGALCFFYLVKGGHSSPLFTVPVTQIWCPVFLVASVLGMKHVLWPKLGCLMG